MLRNITIGNLLVVSMASIMFTGCVSAKKPEKVNSSIVSEYLEENGVTMLHGENCENGHCAAIDPDTGEQVKLSIKKSNYENERDKMMARIIKAPPVPMRVPDTILRTLIMPYADDGDVLNTYSYKFVKIDNGKWIMGEYLMKSNGVVRELSPLSGNVKLENDDDKKDQIDNQQRPVTTSSNMQIPQSVNNINSRMQEDN